MKKNIICSYVFASGLVVGSLHGAQWTPTQTDLDAAVANAAKEWGATPRDSIRIILEKPRTCHLGYAEIGSQIKADPGPEDLSKASAITELRSVTSTDSEFSTEGEEGVTSTVNYDGGTSESFDQSATIVDRAPFVPTIEHEWVIRINGTCNYWTPEHLRRIVLHEYGHTLGLVQHSSNPHSIMYWVVFIVGRAPKEYTDQSITAADRARIATTPPVIAGRPEIPPNTP